MLKQLLLFQCLAVTLIGGQSQEIWDKDLQEHLTVIREVSTPVRSDSSYRLPVTVYPLHYDIDLDLNFEATADRPAYSYDGRVTILIQAAAVNVTQVVLHANVDRINSVSILKNDGTPVALNTVLPIEIIPVYHFLKINLNEYLEYLSNYTLVIDYSSSMNEGPLRRGIWRGQYTDENGIVRTYATTHFQPYNARQAFPCWDEPGFKSTFTLHLTRPRRYGAIFSNTKHNSFGRISRNGRIRDSFSKTPLMSSYLLTFLVSESFQVIAQDTSFNPPIRVIGRSNAAGLGDKALEWAVGMTRYFNEYFGIPYESMDPNLNNDHISSPDWASAGTENWGMVSYRELYMILDTRGTIMSTEHYAATLVSHELAHKWFGNLITCDWWGNTWINEGFASYFGYIATSNVFPEYEHQDHFNSRYMHTTLSTDSALNPSPLNHDVNTPSEVTGHFGTISYSKGAAFLRMVADMITEETFRKACQYFLTDNSFRATSRQDLFNAFARAINEDRSLDDYPNFDFEDFYYTWVDRPGYPVLNVLIDYTTGEMSLSQERYFLSTTASSTNDIYPIPITYTTERNADFSTLKPAAMMSGSNMVLLKESGEEWVIFNKLQHGYYRVNYDERSWELIINALLYNTESIHYLNRGAIVDDVFSFMRSQKLSHSFGFRILSFLHSEVNYHVWEPAIAGYTWLRNRLRHLPERQAEFDAFVLNQMETAIQHVGYDVLANETPTTSQLRQDLLHFACLLKHERCVDESRSRFLALKNGSWTDPRIRRNVYVVGIREGDTSDFDFLMNGYMSSNIANDQLEMMRALAATTDPALLERYLEFTLTNSVRQHDKTNAFNYALLGNKENAKTVLQFLMNNIDRIRASYVTEAPNRPVHTVMSNMAAYLDESELVVYENWLMSTQANSAEYATAISGIASARTNMAWGTANADIILSAARGGSAAVTASLAMLIIVSLLTLLI